MLSSTDLPGKDQITLHSLYWPKTGKKNLRNKKGLVFAHNSGLNLDQAKTHHSFFLFYKKTTGITILDKNSTKNEYKPKCTKINKVTHEKKLLINLPGPI